MSSILKALKKLEQEKAVRRGGNADIARGILRKVAKDKKKPRWLFPVSVAGAALVASLFTLVIMAVFQHSRRTAETITRSQDTVKSPLVPAQGLSVPLTESSKELNQNGNPAEQVVSKAGRIVKTPVSIKSPLTRIRPVGPLPEAASETPSLPEDAPSPPKAQEPAVKAVQLVKPSVGHSLPSLTVSGIAWQKDSTDRVAVVNGTSVSEGVMVEGARVEEIFQDRVRFSFDKQTFDISLGGQARKNITR
jgi:general secretion pathway protein B